MHCSGPQDLPLENWETIIWELTATSTVATILHFRQPMKRSKCTSLSICVARCRRPSSLHALVMCLAHLQGLFQVGCWRSCPYLIGPALVSFRDQDHFMCGHWIVYLCCRQASRGKFRHANARVCSEPCHVDVRLQRRENRPIENELASFVAERTDKILLMCPRTSRMRRGLVRKILQLCVLRVMPIQQSHHLHLR